MVEIEIQSRDKSRVKACCYDSEPGAAAVLFMPAMGVVASYYAQLGEALCCAGLNVVLCELRGTGSSNVRASRRTDFGYRELIADDWPAAIAATRARYPSSPLVIMGHSLGGQITCLHQAREQPSQRVDAIVMLACCSAYHGGYAFPRSLGIGMATQLADVIARGLGYFPGHRLGFGGLQGRTVIADWAREARTGRYRVHGDDSDYTALLARLDVPALSVSFDGDDFGPPGAVDALCARLSPGSVERWHLSAADLQLPRVDHFRWVKGAGQLAPRLARWLQATLG